MVNSDVWSPFQFYGMVLEDYKSNEEMVLSLEIGESVVVIERIQGWYRGFSTIKRKIGIFPQFITEIVTDASTTPICHLSWEKLDQFINDQSNLREITLEIDSVITDWYKNILKLLEKSDYVLFQKLLDSFYSLITKKKELMSNCKTIHQKDQLKKELMGIIGKGNKLISNDEFIRDDGLILKSSKFMELYKLHCESRI